MYAHAAYKYYNNLLQRKLQMTPRSNTRVSTSYPQLSNVGHYVYQNFHRSRLPKIQSENFFKKYSLSEYKLESLYTSYP